MGDIDDSRQVNEDGGPESTPLVDKAVVAIEANLVEEAVLGTPLPPPTVVSAIAEPMPSPPLAVSPPPLLTTSLMWHIVGAVVYGLATVLILALGPIILTFIGPDWLVGLAWLIGAVTAWRMVRHLQGLAQARVEWAAGAALVIGLTLGLGWAVAAEAGWMPPLLASGLRPTASTPTPAPTSSIAAFRIGVRVRVVETGGAGLRVRADAGVDTAPVGFLPEDAVARIVAGPKLADSFRWWQVEGDGVTGWVADPWLRVE